MTQHVNPAEAMAEAIPVRMVKINITKAHQAIELDINGRDIPDNVYQEAMVLGMKELLNRGMGKITKANHPDPEVLKREAMLQAEKNLEALRQGNFRATTKAASTKVAGVIMTEAMRLARILVKDAAKAKGYKVSHIAASEITTAAKAVLEANPQIIEQAKANLEARAATPILVDVAGLKADPTKVKAAADKAAKAKVDKEQTSAAKAGVVAQHAKGKAKGRPATATAH